VCVIGTHDLFEHPHINDLAYMPAEKDGKFGFNLLVGGFISPKRWGEALPLDAWVPGRRSRRGCRTGCWSTRRRRT
jgi:ferredoxin-nitrite reductase